MTDFTGFDSEPEDVYDASDPVPTRLFVIGQIIEALLAEPDALRRARRRLDVIRLLNNLTAEVAGGD